MRAHRPIRLAAASPRGFSLVEVVLVLVITACLAGIVLPRFGNAAAKQRADAAAKRIARDLSLAQNRAITSSASQTVTFNVGASSYTLAGMAAPDHSSQTYQVFLGQEPYNVTMVSANFGGNAVLIFNGYGAPDSDGSIVIRAAGFQKTIALDPDTGQASVQ
jgi:prepilin-type N-terminal cleavage/methylation domain-containing protein